MSENTGLSIKVKFDSEQFMEDIKIAYAEEIANDTFKISTDDLKGMGLAKYMTIVQ